MLITKGLKGGFHALSAGSPLLSRPLSFRLLFVPSPTREPGPRFSSRATDPKTTDRGEISRPKNKIRF